MENNQQSAVFFKMKFHRARLPLVKEAPALQETTTIAAVQRALDAAEAKQLILATAAADKAAADDEVVAAKAALAAILAPQQLVQDLTTGIWCTVSDWHCSLFVRSRDKILTECFISSYSCLTDV